MPDTPTDLPADLSADTAPALIEERPPQGQRSPLRLRLRGRWSAQSLAGLGSALPSLEQQLRRHGAAADWDLDGVQHLDHVGAQLLWNAWGRRWPEVVALHDDDRAILQRVARFTVPTPPLEPANLQQLFLRLGAWLWRLEGHVAAAVRLLGQLALDLLHLLRAPRSGPWREVSAHLYRVGVTALPITALVGSLIGLVLAYLMARQLRAFGADTFIVNVLGLALIRELGPVLAAILIAGRSGSAITAQIGVMRVNEELDAMRVMGIPRGYRLVLPRVLAMALATPLLALWTTVAALAGGMLAADLTLGLTPAFFAEALPKAVSVANLWLGVGKAALFGTVIALVACHFGLRVEPDTQSLGEGTTASVVASITLVLVLDALLAVVFQRVGW